MSYREILEKLSEDIDLEAMSQQEEAPKEKQGLIDPRRVREDNKEQYDPLSLMKEWMKIIKASGVEYRKKAQAQHEETLSKTPEPVQSRKEEPTPEEQPKETKEETKRKVASLFDGMDVGVGEESDEGYVLPRYTGGNGEYVSIAREAAARYGIPEDLFLRQIKQESGWKPDAVSSAGAYGLGQLMPATAKYLGVDAADPVQNLDGSARYLKEQYDKFGRWDYALAAYNSGPGNVDKHGGIPPFKETRNYVSKIMGTN